MKNIKCENCEKEISKKAENCPGCGHPSKASKNLSGWELFFILVMVIIFIWWKAGSDDDSSPKVEEVHTSPKIVTKNIEKPKSKYQGDNAIFSLSHASVICAAVSRVNPRAVGEGTKQHLENSIKLYSLFRNESLAKAKKSQESLYKTITGEPAIKAQSLRSRIGAIKYVNAALVETDASTCNELPSVIVSTLRLYGS